MKQSGKNTTDQEFLISNYLVLISNIVQSTPVNEETQIMSSTNIYESEIGQTVRVIITENNLFYKIGSFAKKTDQFSVELVENCAYLWAAVTKKLKSQSDLALHVVDQGYLNVFMTEMQNYMLIDATQELFTSNQFEKHKTTDKVYLTHPEIVRDFLSGIENTIEFDEDGRKGYQFVMDVLGYEAVQKMVMEYVQYPVTPDFMLIAKAAFSLVRTLSSF